jgi:hypothetical protein
MPQIARWGAVVFMAEAVANGAPRTRAYAQFKGWWDNLARTLGSRPVRKPRVFCDRWWARYNATHAVTDAPRSGRPQKVPPEKALELSKLFKAGQHVALFDAAGNPKGSQRRHFTSIQDACDNSLDMGTALTTYKCTPRALLRAMRAADPDLVKRSTDHKRPLTESERQERQAGAQAMLRDWADKWERAVFIDCATITLDWDNLNQKVWCSRTATDVDARRLQNSILHAFSGANGPRTRRRQPGGSQGKPVSACLWRTLTGIRICVHACECFGRVEGSCPCQQACCLCPVLPATSKRVVGREIGCTVASVCN